MTQIDKAYVEGMARVFEAGGMHKGASVKVSEAIAEIEKKASLFNFSDSTDPYGGSFNWSSIVIPLLAATAAGYVGYQARAKGSGNRSAFDNVKNYIAGIGDKYIRRSRQRPLYDIKRYIDG